MAKSKNHSIRFEESHLVFVQKKKSMESPQKIVNFLLKDFWDRHHMEIPLKPNIEYKAPTQESYDGNKLNPAIHDEAPFWETTDSPLVSKYDIYYKRITNAVTIPEIESIIKEVNADSVLVWAEKKLLRDYAQECSKNMYTD